jgi:hypothetical protein
MEFQIGGDYHEGFPHVDGDSSRWPIPTHSHLILVGDVGTPYLKSSYALYRYISQNWKKVYIVMGNMEHECYWRWYPMSIEAHVNLMKQMIASLNAEIGEERLILLHHSYVDFPTFRLAGCTLWSNGTRRNPLYTDDGLHDASSSVIVKDNELVYNNIHSIYWPPGLEAPEPRMCRKLTTEDLGALQEKETAFIQKMMDECSSKGLNLVMCSHFIPTKAIPNVGPFEKEPYDIYDYLGREVTVQSPISAWICGHVHTPQILNVNDIPIYVNQLRIRLK